MDEAKIENVLTRLHQLPMMPTVVQEVIASFGEPGLDVPTLAAKIAADGGLAAKILRVANSAFYGLQHQVGSIHEAVVLLGFSSVRSLVVAAALQNVFPKTEQHAFDRKAFWQRSVKTAAYARAIAKRLRQDQEMAFIAGLLRDVGVLVLDTYLHEQFADVLARVTATGADLVETEQAVLGFDHAMIGAAVASRWKFPQALQDAIRYGQSSEHEPFAPLTDIVFVAGSLVRASDGGGAEENGIPEAVLTRLGLSREAIEACLSKLEQLEAGTDLFAEA